MLELGWNISKKPPLSSLFYLLFFVFIRDWYYFLQSSLDCRGNRWAKPILEEKENMENQWNHVMSTIQWGSDMRWLFPQWQTRKPFSCCCFSWKIILLIINAQSWGTCSDISLGFKQFLGILCVFFQLSMIFVFFFSWNTQLQFSLILILFLSSIFLIFYLPQAFLALCIGFPLPRANVTFKFRKHSFLWCIFPCSRLFGINVWNC